MTKTKLVSAALATILCSGSSVAMPVEKTQSVASAPVYESDVVVDRNDIAFESESAANVEFVEDEPTTIDTQQAAPLSAVQHYYVKPGDQAIFGKFVADWTDFQYVTEFRKDEWTILSGYLEDYGAWGVSFSDDGRVEGSVELPLTYHDDGLALGLPIAAQIGETTVDGWVFEAEGTVTYCAAPGATYVYGDGWDAMILDERRYLEWKSDNFPDSDKYHFVANDYESWVIASENAPKISAVAEPAPTSEIEALARKIAATSTLQGVTDPKWGAINWSDKIREDTTEGGAIYWLDAELGGYQFSIEIDDGAPLGYTDKYDWSAAIVPNTFVTRSDTSILHYGQYAINVSQNSVIVVDTETGESQQVFLKGDSKQMSDDTTLLTLTDGKHAKCVTMRPELIAFMYTISG